jgi:SAM-dependent methyltransferase
MPIDYRSTSASLSQREAFARSRLARSYREFVDRVVLALIPGSSRVIDIGAGEVVLLEKRRERGAPGWSLALDRHPENAGIARGYGFPAIVGDAAALPVAPATFDVAVLNNMLEHVDDPHAVLSEAHRVLRPGGTAIVLVPHEDNFRRARMLLGRREEAGLDYGHVHFWTPGTLDAALRVAGFTPRHCRNLPLPAWPAALHHLAMAVK